MLLKNAVHHGLRQGEGLSPAKACQYPLLFLIQKGDPPYTQRRLLCHPPDTVLYSPGQGIHGLRQIEGVIIAHCYLIAVPGVRYREAYGEFRKLRLHRQAFIRRSAYLSLTGIDTHLILIHDTGGVAVLRGKFGKGIYLIAYASPQGFGRGFGKLFRRHLLIKVHGYGQSVHKHSHQRVQLQGASSVVYG